MQEDTSVTCELGRARWGRSSTSHTKARELLFPSPCLPPGHQRPTACGLCLTPQAELAVLETRSRRPANTLHSEAERVNGVQMHRMLSSLPSAVRICSAHLPTHKLGNG